MKIFLIVFLISVSLLSGCASIHETFYSKNDNESTHGTYGYKSKIYAGVKQDADIIYSSCQAMACIFAPIGLIDMPFSFVADTLFLPYTATAKWSRERKQARCIAFKKQEAIDAQKNGIAWKDDDVWCKKSY